MLQEVQVPIIENSVCQEMFHTAGHSKNIITSFLCAGYANGQRDSCEVGHTNQFVRLTFNSSKGGNAIGSLRKFGVMECQ